LTMAKYTEDDIERIRKEAHETYQRAREFIEAWHEEEVRDILGRLVETVCRAEPDWRLIIENKARQYLKGVNLELALTMLDDIGREPPPDFETALALATEKIAGPCVPTENDS